MPMTPRAGLQVAKELADFIEREALQGLAIEAGAFWTGVAGVFARFAPENRRLLAVRDDLQGRIDDWHRQRRGQPHDAAATEAFLREIGYLVDEPAPFVIGTRNVDSEVATLAGPQLVVPSLNARFVLNAANARWGSLYDALYGTDALGDLPAPGPYDAARRTSGRKGTGGFHRKRGPSGPGDRGRGVLGGRGGRLRAVRAGEPATADGAGRSSGPDR